MDGRSKRFGSDQWQKLGGFRALCGFHCLPPWLNATGKTDGFGRASPQISFYDWKAYLQCSLKWWMVFAGWSSLRSIFQVEIYQPKIEFRYILPSPHKQIPDDLLDVSNQIKGQFSQLRLNEKLKFQSHLPLVVDNYPALHCWLEDKSWRSRWPSIKGCSRLPSCHLGWGSRPMDGPATRKNFQPKIQKQKSTWRLSREAFLTTLGRVKKP